MAVLGFSHITSEVGDLDKSIAFYRDKGFHLKFNLTMPVPECKFPVVAGRPQQVKLAYLTYADDEACNLELIQHDSKGNAGEARPISLVFFSNRVDEPSSFNDPDGNVISLFKPQVHFLSRHYILPVADLEESISFYEKFNMRVDDRTEFKSFLGHKRCHSLTFQRCLHPHWNGYLHLVYHPEFQKKERPLNTLGFHSFCFLINNAQRDIYDLLGSDKIFGPIQENKQVKGKTIGFKVGFFYDPSGFPVEYLELV